MSSALRHKVNHILTSQVPARSIEQINQVLSHRTQKIRVVLDNLLDHSNAAAIFRTCDLLGIQNIDTIRSQYDFTPHQGRNKGASRKADKWLTIQNYKQTNLCIQHLKNQGYKLWITDLSPGAISLNQIKYRPSTVSIPSGTRTDIGQLENGNGTGTGIGTGTGFDGKDYWVTENDKIALAFGSETNGITDAVRQSADLRVYIPTVGFSQSFNVGSSAAFMLATFRQLGILDGKGDLSEAEKEILRTRFMLHFLERTKIPKQVVLKEMMARAGVVLSEEEVKELIK